MSAPLRWGIPGTARIARDASIDTPSGSLPEETVSGRSPPRPLAYSYRR